MSSYPSTYPQELKGRIRGVDLDVFRFQTGTDGVKFLGGHTGCVAKLKVSTRDLVTSSDYAAAGETEETVDERNLPGDVALRQPPHLPFANHVHCLDTLNRSPRRVKRSEALHRSDPAFDWLGDPAPLRYLR